jgi:hypothetical protein
MPIGLEIVNDSGTYVVTSEHKNLQLKNKGTLTLPATVGSSSGTWPGVAQAQISVTAGTLPFIAFRSSSLVGVTSYVSGGTLYITFFSPTPSASISWYVFDFISSASTSGIGLQVFDDAGGVTFESEIGELRIAGISQMTGVGETTSDLSVAYPAGRTYASIHSTPGQYTSSVGDPGNYDNRDVIAMTRWSGTTLIGRFSVSAAPNTAISQDISDAQPTSYYYSQHPAILVADVTSI